MQTAEERREYKRAWHAAHPRQKARYDKRRSRLLLAQGGVCAICGDSPDPFELYIDHDHACCGRKPAKSTCGGCDRGLLCLRCNSGLGYFRDNPALLAAAAAYLVDRQLPKL